MYRIVDIQRLTSGSVRAVSQFQGLQDIANMQLTTSNSRDFYSSGWLNPLPPQQGIPGWQRMTMMKYFVDEDGHWDDEALWAYEGVVFPGGQIMLGRWWSPEDHTRPEQASLKVSSGRLMFGCGADGRDRADLM